MGKSRTAKQMQNDLADLFDKARKDGDLKVAAYICQVWLSSRAAVNEEEQLKQSQNTSLDKLVKELARLRKVYTNRNPENAEEIADE